MNLYQYISIKKTCKTSNIFLQNNVISFDALKKTRSRFHWRNIPFMSLPIYYKHLSYKVDDNYAVENSNDISFANTNKNVYGSNYTLKNISIETTQVRNNVDQQYKFKKSSFEAESHIVHANIVNIVNEQQSDKVDYGHSSLDEFGNLVENKNNGYWNKMKDIIAKIKKLYLFKKMNEIIGEIEFCYQKKNCYQEDDNSDKMFS